MIRKLLLITAACSLLIAFRWQQGQNNQPQISGDLSNREELLLEVLLQSMRYNHYAPEAINDEFSEKVYTLYLKRMDLNKRFFLADDVKKFEDFKFKLDDAAQAGDFSFFNLVNNTFDQRIKQVEGYYEDILAKPFRFAQKGEFQMDGEKLEFLKDPEELKARWEDYLKLQVLGRVHDRLERQEKAQEKAQEVDKIKTFEEIEKEEREKLLKSYREWSENIKKDSRDDRIANYVNVFANAHEPHSGYFPPLEKENFNIRMSGKLEGIGAQLRQEDGYIKVVNIVPGSASWKQGELEVNDKIVKVAQGNEEAVNVVDMRIDDVLPMIRGKKGTEVRLTVKKTSGETKVIPIIRDVVVLEESYAKSAIVEHKKAGVKMGLIDLRSFYADFQDPKGRRCATDVELEVRKLLQENIDGIVIDLRFNGGGSLSDVVKMTGLFIDRGPVVQVKSRDNRPYVLEDKEAGALYKGPLIILVNAYSASASEIMAAALQDYGRAIIVGSSPSTFGKGTVQRFMDLDAVVPPRYKDLGALGSLKITIQKFYRINGGSTQLKGVEPDIVLPGSYSYLKVGEKDEDYPMAWSEIDPANYHKKKMKALPKLQSKSAKRQAKSKTFQLLEEHGKWLEKQQGETVYPLQLEDYEAHQAKTDKEAEQYKDMMPKIEDFSIYNLKADKEQIALDSVKAKSFEKWHAGLEKDAYLEEVAFILKDYMKLKK
ncbi:C-terminal processing peptidase [Saprospira grandis DSM 2844]|uniref:C-terminal processing peptidase n=1 Tax=Saprospira grandis DSM 2844 TaxID=694433 RepID=J0P5B0_9BACT|nr:carboxy terminal-processing peptidase [Saprospira grandis]EJF52607.1 C-terminal processing peptidase [Saprospira grandis DSM 2844]